MAIRRVRAWLFALGVSASLLTGCASNPGSTLRVLPPRQPTAEAATDSAVVRTALRYLGTPYVLGGTTPSGFDCSGFVWYVYRQGGVDLPRNVTKQATAGRPVTREEVRAGDLVFFITTGPGITHVGMATSRDAFVHAPNSRGVVRVEALTSPYWSQRYAGARRVAVPDRLP